MSQMGHSLPMHSAPVPTDVRYAPKATVSHLGTKVAKRIAIFLTPEPSPKVINPPWGSSALVVALVAVVAVAAVAAAA